jgi:hypothetical protein
VNAIKHGMFVLGTRAPEKCSSRLVFLWRQLPRDIVECKRPCVTDSVVKMSQEIANKPDPRDRTQEVLQGAVAPTRHEDGRLTLRM